MFAIGVGQIDRGLERETNEDNFLVDNDLGLYVVCDGMGGHAAGEVAADLAVKAAARSVGQHRPALERLRSGAETKLSALDIVREAVEDANAEVYRVATTRPEHAGMGCTLTLLLVLGQRAVMAHVGDTRLYLRRGGTVERLSTDHTMVEELVRAGALDAEQAKDHPHAHLLTRAVGAQAGVSVETLQFEVFPTDVFLLCSDGLTRYLPEADALATLVAGDVDGLPEQLVEFAKQGGGEDNITVVAVSLQSDRDAPSGTTALETDMQARLDALATNFLFEGLSLAQALRLLTICSVDAYAPEEVVVAAGDEQSSLLIVMEGSLTVTWGAARQGELATGDCLGAAGLWEPRPHLITATATTPVKLLRVARTDLDELARRRPWLGIAILQRLGRYTARTLENTREQLAGATGASADAVTDLV